MTKRPSRRTTLLAAVALSICVLPAAAWADTASMEQQIAGLKDELANASERLKALERMVDDLATASKSTREALARELAQPMLLLVGDGRCPAGFERIATEVMLLSGPRTPKNSDLIDRAGLADDEQVGVGSRVYRYLDFCFRAANSVILK